MPRQKKREKDDRGEFARFIKEATEANQVLLDFVRKIAEEKEVPLVQRRDQRLEIISALDTTSESRVSENIEST